MLQKRHWIQGLLLVPLLRSLKNLNLQRQLLETKAKRREGEGNEVDISSSRRNLTLSILRHHNQNPAQVGTQEGVEVVEGVGAGVDGEEDKVAARHQPNPLSESYCPRDLSFFSSLLTSLVSGSQHVPSSQRDKRPDETKHAAAPVDDDATGAVSPQSDLFSTRRTSLTLLVVALCIPAVRRRIVDFVQFLASQ